MTDISERQWSRTVSVAYANTDTVSLYDMSVILHTVPDFSEQSLPLTVEVITPDSLRMCEQVVLTAIHDSVPRSTYGKEVEAPYRERIRFSRQGNYTIKITPDEPVAGVESAGVAFEPVTQ